MDDITYLRNQLGDIVPVVEIPVVINESVVTYDDLDYLKDYLQ